MCAYGSLILTVSLAGSCLVGDLIDVTLGRRKSQVGMFWQMATIPIPHSPRMQRSGLVAVGSNIYNIGASIHDSPSSRVSPSSSVSILDCRSHMWLEAPSMQVKRKYSSASFLDGKIYVTGGCYKHYNQSNWMEVFDIKNKTWEPVLSPTGRLTLRGRRDQTNSVVLDGKLYIIADKGVVYNPKDGSWNSVGPEMDLCRRWLSSCVIENVLYYYYGGEGIKWYDSNVRSWRTLNGMKKLLKFAPYANVRLADYGGKMALFWDKFVISATGGGYRNGKIWCAMISLEKRNSKEIWGTVEWFDAVLPHPIPVGCEFEHVVAVNV